jgi:hypothetical protein
MTWNGAIILISRGKLKLRGNFAPHCHKLHHLEYPHFNNQSSHPSSYDYPLQLSSLEDTLKTFIQIIGLSLQEIKDVTMANTQVIAKLEGHIGHLLAAYNRIEEEELQIQLMARGPYMIDEDDLSNSYNEHV